jgi:hypothetical protein
VILTVPPSLLGPIAVLSALKTMKSSGLCVRLVLWRSPKSMRLAVFDDVFARLHRIDAYGEGLFG